MPSIKVIDNQKKLKEKRNIQMLKEKKNIQILGVI